MKIKILVAGFVVGATSALAGIPLGRGEVSPSVTANATYDSNVTAAHDGPEDFLGTITPRLAYDRKAGVLEAQANLGVAFTRYVEQTRFDTDNVNADVSVRTTDAEVRHYSGSLSAAYTENSEANSDLNTRINSKTATFAGKGTFASGPRSTFGLTGNYADARRSVGSNQQDLTTEGVYDYQDFFYGNTLHLAANYEELHSSGENALGADLNQNSYLGSAGLIHSFFHDTLHAGLSYGYRILHRSAAETANRQTRQGSSVITANLDGPFLPARLFPKITSHFSIAYQDAATPGINDTSSKELTGSLTLAWQARQATRVSFAAQRGQRLSADDLTVVSSDVNLQVTQTLRYDLSGVVGVGYNWSSYRGTARQDETTQFNAGLTYHFARSWDSSLTYTFNDTSSTNGRSDFSRHLVSLSLTYNF
jgi:hypothetical protein